MNYDNSMMSSTSNKVVYPHFGWHCNLSLITSKDSLTGVLVNSDTTSWETSSSSSKTARTFTGSRRASSWTEHNKSALTDSATQENHVINWSQATVIDREPEFFTRWIKEAIHIRKEGQEAMNRVCQEPEELSTSFFWWRPLIKVETSSFR